MDLAAEGKTHCQPQVREALGYLSVKAFGMNASPTMVLTRRRVSAGPSSGQPLSLLAEFGRNPGNQPWLARIWCPEALMEHQKNGPPIQIKRVFETNRFAPNTQEKAFLRALPQEKRKAEPQAWPQPRTEASAQGG